MSIADSSYPLLNAFWTMFEFFLWVIWILIMVFIDIFRSHDLSGRAKALWFLFVLFILLLGVLVYLIARGGKMHDRAAQQARQQDAEARAYIQQVAASSPASTADQLTKLADLHDRGSSLLRSSNARRPRPKSWRPHSVRTRGSVCGRARRIRSSSARAHRAGIQPSRGKEAGVTTDGQVGHRWTVMLWHQPTRFVAAGRKAAIPAPLSPAAVPTSSV